MTKRTASTVYHDADFHHEKHIDQTMRVIDGEALKIEDVHAVARYFAPVSLSEQAIQRIQAARAVIDQVAAEGRKIYGITTGFGHLSSVRIPQDQLVDLQHNLLRSHAAGVGEPLSKEVVRAMMFLLAASLARGNSGVRVAVVQQLVSLLNADIVPVIPSRGSVGASGDLAPLAHLALVLIGEGEAWYNGQQMSGAEALQQAQLSPLHLQAKEGLALINGTHLMEAIAVLTIVDAEALLRTAEVACAMSIEGLMGSHIPFDERIHRRRGQVGQQETAAHLRHLLRDSEIVLSHANCSRVQDPYTLRCSPQVLGAVRDALTYCRTIFERELSSVTDNPLVFPEEGDVLSGGNFHGQPLALALDTLAIALAQLASFSERRIYNLMGPHDWDKDGAPLFLAPDPGLNSGFMIAQYAAAALVNEIKILAHPASIDSIPTSAGMEDFVSMGVTSAHKLLRLIELTQQVVAIELMCSAQMLDFRKPLKPGAGVQIAYARVRERVSMLEHDRVLAPDIAKLADAVREGAFADI
ncbi:histidine ammonia-lyase [Thermosporothrix hazakensis]|uniref:Histidine ammonia-lyase n=2 Tax=Thermosporothrix TaxID=768650 RepID=A0A326UCA0_THEHA|nr:histidine ammonia-lyase [Thermosporothrix hazakensis]PZW22905.1 histidine ammonia-lyase [Thermosporothrix hazakensis]BBH89816.1 histidine ammonia-lyase [Thermosporothrix sp. COM3]GCE48004.1 histidine ammonia-lyase [Thermosporothrix hazakensis]